MTLFGYWRSSASYRVRIALALKGIDVNHVTVNLRDGLQKDAEHLLRNPQGFVPVLVIEDGTQLTQSMAILDYLDRKFPNPALLPEDPIFRSKLLAASLVIATDIHPIQNLSVLKYIRAEHGQDDGGVKNWAQHWISNGFTALEKTAQQYETPFLMTEVPSLFECCLIPQVYNARRFDVDMDQFPKLSAIDAACQEHSSFIAALPEHQADAP
ncbi:MAG: maleylacetoacetate isomerase [Acidimicrobiales bacterium]|nr:maleylacetoacetate isomerase [Hyphomonadaceae bacterium]RZV42106.1 MAG: maleylacetoacetate isomerase [Acidimicrobiales bacterium]